MTSLDDKARELRAIASRLSNMAPMLRVIGEDVRTFIDDRFTTATDATGSPWAALRPATLSINPRRVGGTPLSDTGRTRQSITIRVGSNTLSFGTNVVQAPPLFFGNPNNRVFGKAPGPIRARNPLPVTRDGQLQPSQFWDDVRERLSHWLATGEAT